MTKVTGYTLAGVATSALVGACLGLLGNLALPTAPARAGVVAALIVAGIGLFRETSFPGIPLPQIRRQTPGIWAKRWPGAVAPVMWGLDLGLIFTTWLTFSGAWLLAALAILSGSAGFGARLFVAFWLGTALSVWIGPALLPSARATPDLMDAIAGQHRLFRRSHAAGLVVAMVLLAWIYAESMSL